MFIISELVGIPKASKCLELVGIPKASKCLQNRKNTEASGDFDVSILRSLKI